MPEPVLQPPVWSGPLRHEVLLPTGRLSLEVDRADWPWQRLCGFAARHNPRRGFLFVSKVLGKHWPSPPSEMAAAHEALAAPLPPPPTDRPALFIGMAETATGLGQGVFEAYLSRHGAGSAVYLQTTRCWLSGAQTLGFEEQHSHAQNLHLHWPQTAALRQAFSEAPWVVLVDDELSTGQTFLSLVAAYRKVNPALQRVSVVSLTDFMGEAGRQRFKDQAPVEQVDFVSLLSGAYRFEPDPDFKATVPPSAQAAVGCRRAQVGPFSARFGTDQALSLPPSVWDQVHAALPAAGPMLVLGTGEFMHPAYCVARALAAQGRAVQVQSTTRSPILLGADIRRRIELEDPYGEGIPNYLYNVDPAEQTVLLCCEAQPSHALSDTVRRLGARLVAMGQLA
ncbi:MAG: phosphoribosyltransferase domain-containing protein [Pseudomonadota bacterium]